MKKRIAAMAVLCGLLILVCVYASGLDGRAVSMAQTPKTVSDSEGTAKKPEEAAVSAGDISGNVVQTPVVLEEAPEPVEEPEFA